MSKPKVRNESELIEELAKTVDRETITKYLPVFRPIINKMFKYQKLLEACKHANFFDGMSGGYVLTEKDGARIIKAMQDLD